MGRARARGRARWPERRRWGRDRSPLAGPRGRTIGSVSSRPPFAAIGVAASTGGPGAVERFLRALGPPRGAVVLVAQHMRPEVLEGFVRRLGRRLGPWVAPTRPGLPLPRGRAWVVPAHGFVRVAHDTTGRPRLWIDPGRGAPPPRPAPSADDLLTGLARVFGARTLAVVLSGMGRDGWLGAHAVARAGGVVLAQDAASSDAWGMPGAVTAAGLTAATGPPETLAGHAARFLAAARARAA